MKPFPGLIGAVGGQRWELDVERAAGGGLNRGGAAPAALGGGKRFEELRHGESKLTVRSTRAERCRRWGLRGEPVLRGNNGGGHGRGSG